MGIDGTEINKNSILKKQMQAPERCEVIVTEEKPLHWNFTRKMKFSWWNFIMVIGTPAVSHSTRKYAICFQLF